ncbi:hypothetical protein, partial [Pseudoalteromonas ruthenica]|uniref:hypothetical protein n=1 Tax=Pseudoalteromonas ruthenica TaxID=151081 RepID=UPI001BB0FCEB
MSTAQSAKYRSHPRALRCLNTTQGTGAKQQQSAPGAPPRGLLVCGWVLCLQRVPGYLRIVN